MPDQRTIQSRSIIIMLLLMMMIGASTSYKVLYVPIPLGSHMVLLSSAAEAWVEAGHEAHVVKPRSVPIPSQYQNSKIRYIDYGNEGHVHVTQTDKFTETLGKLNSMNLMATFSYMTDVFNELCTGILRHEDLYHELVKNKYDFVIVDEVPVRDACFQGIPHRLGVPYATLTVVAPFDMLGMTLQTNYLSASLPLFHTNEPSFVHRFSQFFAIQLFTTLRGRFNHDDILHYIRDRPVSDLFELKANSKLWFVDMEPLIDAPKHSPPNLIYVGGMSCAPAKPLTKELQSYADSAKDGLVVVSFGGSLTSEFPEEMLRKLLTGLSLVKYKVIIRLKTKPSFEIGRNILIVKWLPQNDLLGHKNTVLFVTHCGLSSINEAVYHGIPMLGFPNQLEQKSNAERFARKNFGLVMDREAFSAEELKDNIEKLMTDATWKNAIKRASMIIKNRRYTSRDEAVYWTEHVIKYGADHLTPSTIKLAWYQILMLDIMAAVLFIVLVLVYLLVKCLRCTKRTCCGKSDKRKHA